MVTAAAVAHVNRLPVLFVPGDVFANRRPDPVLQQVEDFGDGTVSANDCFRPVSRYFDRITRPEQIIGALQRAMAVLTDPAECGPVTLAFCQDVQAEAFDYPASFFAERVWTPAPRSRPDEGELAAAVAALRGAKKPLIIAGGGVLYSGATDALAAFAEAHDVPVAETQAGKSSIPATHPLAVGSVGVTGTSAANRLAEEADVVLAVGTRLQDFTTGSWALFKNPKRRFIALNVQVFDALKHRALPLVADAKAGLEELSANLAGWRAGQGWRQTAESGRASWMEAAGRATGRTNTVPPSDAQVIGAVQRAVVGRHGRGLRLGRAARRTAQALAGRAAARLPPRIRLFVHGLRDRRRHRRQARPARARRRRHGRRRLLPDDEFRDRHLGAPRPEAHHRRPRQSRLRLHQPAAAWRPAARASTTSSRTRATWRCRRSTSAPMPRASAPSPRR